MPKNFLLTFGGTGSRIAEAVCYLKASGFSKDPLHVLLVDPDGANGNVATAWSQLQRYVTLGGEYDTGDPSASEPPIFSSQMNPEHGPGSLFWEYPNARKPFGRLIGYGGLDKAPRALIELLYDSDDLDMTFEVGYVGRAHVGSLDLFQTIRGAVARAAEVQPGQRHGTQAIDEFFGALRSEAQTGEARLMVAGSVFGGTGASGIPIIPALLSELLPQIRERVVVGGLLFGPYFTFGQGEDDAPDSALHPLATRAALYHYARTQVGFDSMYFLGAPDRTETNRKNYPGGSNQLNKAHYVELAGAAGVEHFFTSDRSHVTGGQLFTSGARDVSWGDLPGGAEDALRQRLSSFTVASLLHRHFLHGMLESGSHQGHRWLENLDLGPGDDLGGKEERFTELHAFMDRYLDWVREVNSSSLDGGGSPLLAVPARPTVEALARVLAEESPAPEPFDQCIRIMNRVEATGLRSPIARYMAMLGQSSRIFSEQAYSGWSW